MDKAKYEKLQRIQFKLMFVVGIALIILGSISLVFAWQMTFKWAVSGGLGLILYGGTGSYLTSTFHIRKVKRRAEVEEEVGAPPQKKFITKYISTPGGGVMTFVIFILSMVFLTIGVIELIHFLNAYVW